MTANGDTVDSSKLEELASPGATAAVPGLVLLFSGGQAVASATPLLGGVIELGREHPAFGGRPDPRISQRHARVGFDGRRFTVVDLGSRNGTAVDGESLSPGTGSEVHHVIRIGDSLFVPMHDIGPLQRHGVRVAAGRVEGPALQEALRAAAAAVRFGATLHITGESGSGKEGIARAFHAGGSAKAGSFQAVNCAAIPEGVAERLLFGTRRGAYSGADADADGYVQAADGGTLFLDEVAELLLPVQAKLLRVLETGEVLALGASRPRKVDLRVCTATHRDLRALVATGKLREDLYFRIARPHVIVPPLRERPEEIPWLLGQVVKSTAPGRALHVSLVEACLVKVWPGNVRELLVEARSAVQAADAEGAARVTARHLSASAGSAFTAAPEPAAMPSAGSPRPPTPAAGPSDATPETPRRPAVAAPGPERLAALLQQHGGNVSAAARALQVHRTQLRRWLKQHGLDAVAASESGDE